MSAFQIGNEPDLYSTRTYYGDTNVRPASWGFSEYLDEFGRFSRRLKQLRSWLPIAGPTSCCVRPWDTGFPRFLDRFASPLALTTFHHHLRCYKNEDVPLSLLLSDKVLEDGLIRLNPHVGDARGKRLGVRLTETQSNACRNDERLAVALWAVDWLFGLASIGIKGADFHQIGDSPFDVNYVGVPPAGQWTASVSPLYYAMVLFARSVPDGAKLLFSTFAQRRADGANARSWATFDRNGTVRIVAINKRTAAGYVVVRVPGASREGTLQRLRGEDLSSGEGVTLAGQSVPDGSTTGTFEGEKVLQKVAPGPRATYRFRLPGASIALLTIRHVR